jgi:hypothetical protein
VHDDIAPEQWSHALAMGLAYRCNVCHQRNIGTAIVGGTPCLRCKGRYALVASDNQEPPLPIPPPEILEAEITYGGTHTCGYRGMFPTAQRNCPRCDGLLTTASITWDRQVRMVEEAA